MQVAQSQPFPSHGHLFQSAAWSPCSRFVAVGLGQPHSGPAHLLVLRCCRQLDCYLHRLHLPLPAHGNHCTAAQADCSTAALEQASGVAQCSAAHVLLPCSARLELIQLHPLRAARLAWCPTSQALAALYQSNHSAGSALRLRLVDLSSVVQPGSAAAAEGPVSSSSSSSSSRMACAEAALELHSRDTVRHAAWSQQGAFMLLTPWKLTVAWPLAPCKSRRQAQRCCLGCSNRCRPSSSSPLLRGH